MILLIIFIATFMVINLNKLQQFTVGDQLIWQL